MSVDLFYCTFHFGVGVVPTSCNLHWSGHIFGAVTARNKPRLSLISSLIACQEEVTWLQDGMLARESEIQR